VTPADFEFLCGMLKARSGLVLSSEKRYLVESRLFPIVRKAGLSGLGALIQKLKDPAEPLIAQVVEAMTTNESFFFRDRVPFEQFRDVILPSLMAARPDRRLQIWCAAASSGQEPYSLAMCLREMQHRIAGWRVEILATDLSTEMLSRAAAGLYTQLEVQRGLPIALLIKYFSRVGEHWQIAPSIREMVQFRPLNLLQDFTHLGSFDVVFCRNVLIYFDQAAKTKVLQNIARLIRPDGYLVLGAAETVVGVTMAFEPATHDRGLYVPTRAGRHASVPSAPREATARAIPVVQAR
jgi:chemotaxis protein methyltransferase CheR